ncbi:MAG: DNA-binding GntR family transcriptional regulator [Brevundimonas sp.]|jgi:DNA-binding GntR family transcriptional regulator|uniref:GntR family transcriptional regulator n=1 Tax=Brevundimonas sp. TaxID=1871086 RepID=UPI0039E5D1F9
MEHALRDPYGDALRALRELAAAGRFGWGEPLVVKDLAEEIGYSHTPVREALACLAGEGLFERRRGRGYFFPSLTAADVIDLWDLDWAYLHAALRLHDPRLTGLQKAAGGVGRAAFEDLFTALIACSGNSALGRAHGQLADRLIPVRRAESALSPHWTPGPADLISAAREGRHADFLELFEAHHRQRCALAEAVAVHMQRAGREKI